MNPALQLTSEEIRALAARCYRSRVEFCRIFLPDWFPTKMPWVHRGILALIARRTEFLLDFGTEVWRDETASWTPGDLDKILTNFIDERTKLPIFKLEHDEAGTFSISIDASSSVVIMLPRGYSKTTLLNANTIAEACYHDTDFFLYLSEAAPHAERQLDTVKGEFESNEMLRLVFGDKRPARQDGLTWSVNFIETIDGVMVGALGTGGKVRGFGKRGKRPKLLLFDDLQDEKSVESPTELASAKRWFLRAARPAKAKGGRDIMLGTLLHEEAVLNVAMRSRAFTAVRFGAYDRQGDPLWGFMHSREEIESLRTEAQENGELQGFYMEYMSEFRSDEVSTFPESKMIYVHKGLELFHAVGLAMDPAISKSSKAAETAMAVVGMEPRGYKHVLEYHGRKGMDALEMIDKYFELHFKWMSHLPLENQKHGIEAVQFQAALLPLMRTEMVARSRDPRYGQRSYFEVVPIYHGKTQKESRIKMLKRPIWAGTLTFESETRSSKLHGQFVGFGNSSNLVDGPDAVAMAVALLDPYVMLGLEEEGAPAPVANENFLSVDQELGEWRFAP